MHFTLKFIQICNKKTLDDMIRQVDNPAVKDGQIGFGLGCIYAVAKGGQTN
jgi:hypothetical protein